MHRSQLHQRTRRKDTGPQHISGLMAVVLRRYNIDINDLAEPLEAEPIQMTLFDEASTDSSKELVANY